MDFKITKKKRVRNKEREALTTKNWKQRNPEKVKAMKQRWYQKNKDSYFSKYYQERREGIKEKARKHYWAHRDAILARSKELHNPRTHKKNNLWKQYRLTIEKYEEMVQNQNNLCAICQRPSIKKPLAVDHDHKTGKIRGLLCPSCNMGLGAAESVQNWCKLAEAYLLRFS